MQTAGAVYTAMEIGVLCVCKFLTQNSKERSTGYSQFNDIYLYASWGIKSLLKLIENRFLLRNIAINLFLQSWSFLFCNKALVDLSIEKGFCWTENFVLEWVAWCSRRWRGMNILFTLKWRVACEGFCFFVLSKRSLVATE